MIYTEVVVNTNIYTVPDPSKVKYLSTPAQLAQQMSPILNVSALTLNHIRHIQPRRNANNSFTINTYRPLF